MREALFGTTLLASFLGGAVALSAPGVLIDGEPFSYGRLSERKLRRALEKRRTSA